MPDLDDPSIARRRLRRELRAARESGGLTQQKAAEKLDWSLSKLLRIESGAVAVSVTDARALMSVYGITDEGLVASLVADARSSRGRPWWHQYREFVRPQFAQFLGYEAVATTHRVFGLALIPGILQTRDYADAVIRAHAMPDGGIRTDPALALRIERGTRLFARDDVREVVVLLDECALRRPVGGPEIMRRQLRHLLAAAALPTVSLGVIPFSAGVHGAMNGSFTILQFAEEQDDVLYFDGASRDVLIRDDSEQIAGYLEKFEDLRASAVTGNEATALVEALADDLPSSSTRV